MTAAQVAERFEIVWCGSSWRNVARGWVDDRPIKSQQLPKLPRGNGYIDHILDGLRKLGGTSTVPALAAVLDLQTRTVRASLELEELRFDSRVHIDRSSAHQYFVTLRE
jgi:hypothetical protein